MTRPPRRVDEPLLLPAPQLVRAALMGLAVLAAALLVAILARAQGLPVSEVRTLVMTALTAGNLALATALVQLEFHTTSWRGPAARVLLGVGLAAVGVWAAAIAVPGLRNLLALSLAQPMQVAASAGLAVLVVIAVVLVIPGASDRSA